MICKTNTSVCVCGKDNPCKASESMTKEIKIKCDDCKFVENCVDYGWKDCKKFTPKSSEPMTNEEHIKSLDTEQLAEWLSEKLDYCQIMWYWACDKCTWSKKHESCMNDKEKWVEWLKQPHKDGKS